MRLPNSVYFFIKPVISKKISLLTLESTNIFLFLKFLISDVPARIYRLILSKKSFYNLMNFLTRTPVNTLKN